MKRMTESWAPPDYSKLLAALLLFSCWGCTSPAPRYVVDMRTSPFSCFVQLGSSASPVSCDGLVLHEGDIITFRYEQATDFVDEHGRMPVLWSLWGDNDDGRVLPFGPGTPEAKNDHRYLIAITASAFGDAELGALASGQGTNTAAEVFWTLGPEAAATLPAKPAAQYSRAFADGGVYIMRAGNDHIFIDGGPVGMAGRGGHGHNDCLSLEAVLEGVPLIIDCGAYIYTADTEWRNSFRSTAFHNTPLINGKEQNRFVAPEYLWTLRNDATPDVRHWRSTEDADGFVGAHGGYRRLASPVTPVRAVGLTGTGGRAELALPEVFQ